MALDYLPKKIVLAIIQVDAIFSSLQFPLNFNFCLPRPPTTCTSTNGITSNTAGTDCKCGSSNCIASSGYYCTESTSTCADSPNCDAGSPSIVTQFTTFQLFDFLVYTVWACLKGMTL